MKRRLNGISMVGLVVAACAVLVMTSVQTEAALLLNWQNGTLTSQATGVSGAATTAYQISQSGSVDKLNNLAITVTMTVLEGYSVSGLTAQFTLAPLLNVDSITVGGQTFTASGGTLSTPIVLPNVAGPGQQNVTFTLSGATYNGNSQPHTVSFSDIQFNGTVVPEPTHVAMGAFGVILLGVRFGRSSLAKLRNR